MTRVVVAVLLLGTAALGLGAQAADTYKTRLSTVPIDLAMQATVTGTGTATAVLTGSRLSVSGTYTGLKSRATAAHVFRSVAPGVRGTSLFDLEVTGGTEGTFSGGATLTRFQVDDLGRGRLYVQIHSESAPDGNLREWLMREELKR